MKLDFLQSIKSIGRLRFSTGLFLTGGLLGGTVLATHWMPSVISRLDPATGVTSKEETGKNGEVVGIFTDNPQAIPTPTHIRKESAIKPTPTPPAPTPATNNPNSNSPSSNESNNNPSNQQTNTNPKPPAQSIGASASTPTPTSPTATTVPQTPTPDNTPFEASWETGNNPLATITANKPLKRCLWKQWGVEEKAEGEEIANGNSCTILSAVWRTVEPHKLWVKAEAVSGETKEFGDSPPSQ